MCKEHENRMMFNNFPDHVEEPDPDEWRELYPERWIECPECGEITFRLVNVLAGIEEYECENCWHYGTFPPVNDTRIKAITDNIMKEFDRIIGVIKDFK